MKNFFWVIIIIVVIIALLIFVPRVLRASSKNALSREKIGFGSFDTINDSNPLDDWTGQDNQTPLTKRDTRKMKNQAKQIARIECKTLPAFFGGRQKCKRQATQDIFNSSLEAHTGVQVQGASRSGSRKALFKF